MYAKTGCSLQDDKMKISGVKISLGFNVSILKVSLLKQQKKVSLYSQVINL